MSGVAYQLFADIVVVLHAGFVVFVVLGGLLALRWPKAAWIHLPAALWGIWIEFSGGICPLTPLEHWLRAQGGERGYSGGFIEHYLLPILYPAHLTHDTQFVLGAFALAVNATVYAVVWRRTAHEREPAPHDQIY